MVQIETLPNGVRLVTEAMDTVRSAALGIWVGGGSREETPEESGAAHFIEHMLFKGTQRRTAQDIARETDAIGGQMNAFTTKECTCFYGRPHPGQPSGPGTGYFGRYALSLPLQPGRCGFGAGGHFRRDRHV